MHPKTSDKNYRTLLTSVARHSGIDRSVSKKYGHCPVYLNPATLKDAIQIFPGVNPRNIYQACHRALMFCETHPVDGFSVKLIGGHLTLKIEE